MLGKRYQYDRNPDFLLTEAQLTKKAKFESKLSAGIYQLESPYCAVCNKRTFEPIAEKDSYGLPAAVKICRACGLIQTNPRLNASSYKGFYNEEYQVLIHGAEEINEQQ